MDNLPHVIIDSDEAGESYRKKLKEQLYKDVDCKIHMVGKYLEQNNAEIEDLIPPNIMERVVAPYLQNEDMNPFTISVGSPCVNQIEKFAANNGVTLPNGWKVDVAKKAKFVLSRTPMEQIEKKYFDIWVKLFDAISQ